ncbi:hypothetical protein G6F57_021286 [Rhizopus arrhizus]|nr:hypothetical protein G6F57_021286 [Rhizopus arrhizus]
MLPSWVTTCRAFDIADWMPRAVPSPVKAWFVCAAATKSCTALLATDVSLCSFRVTVLPGSVLAVRFCVTPSIAVDMLLLLLLTVMPLISTSASVAAVCCTSLSVGLLL